VSEIPLETKRGAKRSRLGVIALAVSAILILGIGDWPYVYYQFLRIAACGLSVAVAYCAHKNGRIGWLLFGQTGTVLFNPFYAIELTKEQWQFPYLIFGIGYAVFGSCLTFTIDEWRRWLPRVALGGVAIAGVLGVVVMNQINQGDSDLGPTMSPTRDVAGIDAAAETSLDSSDAVPAIDASTSADAHPYISSAPVIGLGNGSASIMGELDSARISRRNGTAEPIEQLTATSTLQNSVESSYGEAEETPPMSDVAGALAAQ
jgi:hypothetical protein